MYAPNFSKTGEGIVSTLFILLLGAVLVVSILAERDARNNKQSKLHNYSLQAAFARLNQSREDTSVKFIDGMRVLCLFWVMTLGVCQFTMGSSVANPWSL